MSTDEEIFIYTRVWDMVCYLGRISRDSTKAKLLVRTPEFQNLFEILNSEKKG